jgi:hypothetical protein
MLKSLTESEKLTLSHLLYLVTHHDAVNMAVLANYGASRIGNPGLPNTEDFATTLESLYAKSCR